MAHPPARGALYNGTRPLVHRGFLSSWQAKGLNSRVIDHIKMRISEMQLPLECVHILVTGGPLRPTQRFLPLARAMLDCSSLCP